ncbi:MAG TPA: RHS repeat-associated core domain-containing protein [Candidatus Angelobacter sp.]|nr:RHS repeat-associated core domain-containing protein [Candidatus Angelobacter sp.]
MRSAGRRTGVGGSYARTTTPAAVSPGTPPNANNQLTQWNGKTLSYDLNGNLTSDGTNTYTWNARNQLVSVSGGVTASFQYDAFGRRVSKTIGVTTQFLYDGANPVQEISGGSASANLVTGGVDEYFQRTDSAGARSFLTDALGSTLALADSTGTLQTSYTFEPFGSTSVTGAATTNGFAYTGRELDASGLYFYRARYYSPYLDRFISEDPLGLAGGDTNLYGYVFNSPVNFVDPLGFDALTRIGGGLQALGGLGEAAVGFGFAAATSWTGIGLVGGGLVGLHGLDQVQAGLRSAFSGCKVDSLTSSGLQAAGLSQNAANLVDAGISLVGGGLAGAGAAGARAGQEGIQFSHFIPDRLGGRRSIFNGNYVSEKFHYLTDTFSYPPGWQSFGEKLVQRLPQEETLGSMTLRLPWVYGGAAAGAAAGAGSLMAGRNCGCN